MDYFTSTQHLPKLSSKAPRSPRESPHAGAQSESMEIKAYRAKSKQRRSGTLSSGLPPHVLKKGAVDSHSWLKHRKLSRKDIFATSDWESFARANTMGDGPVKSELIDEALDNLEVTPMRCKPSVEVVICGRQGWNPDDLDFLIQERRGKKLRVYSQEMFFFWVNARIDPYDFPSVRKFGRNHPALEFLMNHNFEWPSCHVDPSHKGLEEFGSIRIGVLKRMGYEVGMSGIASASDRQGILVRVFEQAQLPLVGDFNHMREWGGPKSAVRLRKMATDLSTFIRNATRIHSQDMTIAIRHWSEDLKFLRDNIYRGRFDGTFQWPNPNVG